MNSSRDRTRDMMPPRPLSFKESLVILGKLLSDSSEIMLGQNISLTDSISLKTFELPCRALGCKHIQCFDFQSYLHVNIGKIPSAYMCPICSQVSNPSKVYVDAVSLCLLKILPDGATVSLMKDGSFEMKSKQVVREVINIDDDAEEEVTCEYVSATGSDSLGGKMTGSVFELSHVVPFTLAKAAGGSMTNLSELTTASLDDVLHLMNVDTAWGVNSIPKITSALQECIRLKRPYVGTSREDLYRSLKEVDGVGSERSQTIVDHLYSILQSKLTNFGNMLKERTLFKPTPKQAAALCSPVVQAFLLKNGALKKSAAKGLRNSGKNAAAEVDQQKNEQQSSGRARANSVISVTSTSTIGNNSTASSLLASAPAPVPLSVPVSVPAASHIRYIQPSQEHSRAVGVVAPEVKPSLALRAKGSSGICGEGIADVCRPPRMGRSTSLNSVSEASSEGPQSGVAAYSARRSSSANDLTDNSLRDSFRALGTPERRGESRRDRAGSAAACSGRRYASPPATANISPRRTPTAAEIINVDTGSDTEGAESVVVVRPGRRGLQLPRDMREEEVVTSASASVASDAASWQGGERDRGREWGREQSNVPTSNHSGSGGNRWSQSPFGRIPPPPPPPSMPRRVPAQQEAPSTQPRGERSPDPGPRSPGPPRFPGPGSNRHASSSRGPEPASVLQSPTRGTLTCRSPPASPLPMARSRSGSVMTNASSSNTHIRFEEAAPSTAVESHSGAFPQVQTAAALYPPLRPSSTDFRAPRSGRGSQQARPRQPNSEQSGVKEAAGASKSPERRSQQHPPLLKPATLVHPATASTENPQPAQPSLSGAAVASSAPSPGARQGINRSNSTNGYFNGHGHGNNNSNIDASKEESSSSAQQASRRNRPQKRNRFDDDPLPFSSQPATTAAPSALASSVLLSMPKALCAPSEWFADSPFLQPPRCPRDVIEQQRTFLRQIKLSPTGSPIATARRSDVQATSRGGSSSTDPPALSQSSPRHRRFELGEVATSGSESASVTVGHSEEKTDGQEDFAVREFNVANRTQCSQQASSAGTPGEGNSSTPSRRKRNRFDDDPVPPPPPPAARSSGSERDAVIFPMPKVLRSSSTRGADVFRDDRAEGAAAGVVIVATAAAATTPVASTAPPCPPSSAPPPVSSLSKPADAPTTPQLDKPRARDRDYSAASSPATRKNLDVGHQNTDNGSCRGGSSDNHSARNTSYWDFRYTHPAGADADAARGQQQGRPEPRGRDREQDSRGRGNAGYSRGDHSWRDGGQFQPHRNNERDYRADRSASDRCAGGRGRDGGGDRDRHYRSRSPPRRRSPPPRRDERRDATGSPPRRHYSGDTGNRGSVAAENNRNPLGAAKNGAMDSNRAYSPRPRAPPSNGSPAPQPQQQQRDAPVSASQQGQGLVQGTVRLPPPPPKQRQQAGQQAQGEQSTDRQQEAHQQRLTAQAFVNDFLD